MEIAKLNGDEFLLAAAAVSIALSKGKSKAEVESLINFISLINDSLRAVAAQIAIRDNTLKIVIPVDSGGVAEV